MRAKYVLTEVFVGLWRNVTMTIAMIITMAVSLTMLGASLMLYLQVGDMKDWYYDKVQVSVFLTSDISDQQRADLKTRLETDPAVQKVFWESKEQAYERFKQQFRDLPDLVKSIGPDSLPESFRVTLKDPNQSTAFKTALEKAAGLDTTATTDDGTAASPSADPSASPSGGTGTTTATTAAGDTKPIAGIKQVVDQKKLLEKIFSIIGSVQSMALIVSVAMGIAALLLVANTIQVAAYSKRREVAVMKLVGASNWFIQAPFVLEAVFAALLGSVLAFLALVAGKVFLMDGSLSDLNQILTPLSWGRVLLMLPIIALIGGLISSITGWVTLRAYIKK
ncbi:permease-like cell division protein FtsX [Hamadaea tsunoensis]|uniref:permease-like cell division protein FtsX n=1 Tax=Hamadaea tsunoensis TaxID=53368 RepID=UPI00041123A1|nr:permease-like cell division protein FtsX [Hamadaea tsunoensis]